MANVSRITLFVALSYSKNLTYKRLSLDILLIRFFQRIEMPPERCKDKIMLSITQLIIRFKFLTLRSYAKSFLELLKWANF